MPRGGHRKGAGGKPTWNHGKTKPVRIPIALEEKILEIARILDEEGLPESSGQVLDLTGIAVMTSKYGPVIRLLDLVRAGYRIKPEGLVRGLKASTDQSFELDDVVNRAIESYE